MRAAREGQLHSLLIIQGGQLRCVRQPLTRTHTSPLAANLMTRAASSPILLVPSIVMKPSAAGRNNAKHLSRCVHKRRRQAARALGARGAPAAPCTAGHGNAVSHRCRPTGQPAHRCSRSRQCRTPDWGRRCRLGLQRSRQREASEARRGGQAASSQLLGYSLQGAHHSLLGMYSVVLPAPAPRSTSRERLMNRRCVRVKRPAGMDNTINSAGQGAGGELRAQ